MSGALHLAFADTLKHICNADKSGDAAAVAAVAPQQHPLYLSIMAKAAAEQKAATKHAVQQRQEVELVCRQHEEKYMRAATRGERPCKHDRKCEGVLIAEYVYQDASRGFVCPAFVYPSGKTSDMCVLCMRKQTALGFYMIRAGGQQNNLIIQPYRNIVECDGEYKVGACIYPSRRSFESITDPFVRYHRHLYKYDGRRIVQRPAMLYFRDAPSRNTVLVDDGDTLPRRGPYSRATGICLRKFSWHQLDDVTAAFQYCSFFCGGRRTEVPIVHVMSKALPQRCQFRNLKEICTKYCDVHPYFVQWMSKVVLCSLGGYYEHSVAVCDAIRIQLVHGFLHTSTDEWKRWIHSHHYVLFYAIKELISVLVKLDPALHETLRSTYQWNMFCKTSRDGMKIACRVMHENHAHSRGLFTDVNAALAKFNMHSLQFLYKLPRVDLIRFLYQTTQLCRQRKYWLSPQNMQRVTASFACDDELSALIKNVATYRYLYPKIAISSWVGIFSAAARVVARRVEAGFFDNTMSLKLATDLFAGLPARDFAAVNLYISCLFSVDAIHVFRLGAHTLQQHAAAGNSSVYYVCPACCTFKGFVVGQNGGQTNFHARGFSKIMLDDETGHLYCARRDTRHRGSSHRNAKKNTNKQLARIHRRAEEYRKCAVTQLVPVEMAGVVLQCYGKLYVLCASCCKPCVFDMANSTTAGICCPVCVLNHRQPHHLPRDLCFFCGVLCKNGRHWLNDIMLQNSERTQLCRRHAVKTVRQHREYEWTKDELRTTIIASISKQPPKTRKRA